MIKMLLLNFTFLNTILLLFDMITTTWSIGFLSSRELYLQKESSNDIYCDSTQQNASQCYLNIYGTINLYKTVNDDIISIILKEKLNAQPTDRIYHAFSCTILIKLKQTSCRGDTGPPGIVIQCPIEFNQEKFQPILSHLRPYNIKNNIFLDRDDTIIGSANDFPDWIQHSIHDKGAFFKTIKDENIELLIFQILSDFETKLLQYSSIQERVLNKYNFLNEIQLTIEFSDQLSFPIIRFQTCFQIKHIKESGNEEVPTIQLTRRNIIGQGQHRTLLTELEILLPIHFNLINNKCTVSSIDLLPPELYTDLDELEHQNKLSNQSWKYRQHMLVSNMSQDALNTFNDHIIHLIDLKRIGLSAMNIELPSYDWHSTMILHSDKILLSNHTLNSNSHFKLIKEFPIHIRYQAPCPNTFDHTMTLFFDNNCDISHNYRELNLELPIIFMSCMSNKSHPDTMSVSTSSKRSIIVYSNSISEPIKLKHPVGNLSHIILAAAITLIGLFTSCTTLVWVATKLTQFDKRTTMISSIQQTTINKNM